MPLFATGNTVGSRSILMPRYRWHSDTVGWPTERVDTINSDHVFNFTCKLDVMFLPHAGGRPMAYC